MFARLASLFLRRPRRRLLLWEVWVCDVHPRVGIKSVIHLGISLDQGGPISHELAVH